ncbi:MAG: lactonase family protein [Bifidobacterium crudilactis]|uniref:lactonase family protein n=1 Tax=Bifidobacterium crudilactis TaxID=327277 RepID=UPI003F988F6F
MQGNEAHRHASQETTSTRPADILIGGFGSQGGGDCLGIDWIRTSYPENTEHSDSVGLEHRGLLAELPSPTWLLVEDSVVYAPLEFNNEVVALKVSKSGEGLHLEPLSRVSVQGDTPTHLAVSHDASGKAHLLVACYGDGNVCVLPLESDGSIGEHGQVLTNEGHGPLPAQECPHAHWILPLPDGRILSTDLGADRIHVHQWEDDRLRRTSSIVCAPGTGPRDMHLLPSAAGQEQGWRVAVVDEWSRTVDVYAPQADAANGFTHTQRVGLDADVKDQAASLAFVSDAALAGAQAPSAEAPSPSTTEGYCYVGLRGSDRIIRLRWDGERLAEVGGFSSGGGRPRHIKAIGNSLFVANQTTGKLSTFTLSSDGEATPSTEIIVGSPTAVAPLY